LIKAADWKKKDNLISANIELQKSNSVGKGTSQCLIISTKLRFEIASSSSSQFQNQFHSLFSPSRQIYYLFVVLLTLYYIIIRQLA